MKLTSLLLLAACASAVRAQAPAKGIPPIAGEQQNIRGVRYIEMLTGTGEEIKPGSCVFVHYTGWLADGTRFESSLDSVPGRPLVPIGFVQGTHAVIDGWEIGIEGMRAGGARRLFVPFRLGYGDGGSKTHIPPRTNLVFDLEVKAVTISLPGPRGKSECPPWSEVSGG